MSDGRKLLLGKPGSFDALLLRAANQREAQRSLHRLAYDPPAMARLRSGWRRLYPAQSASVTGRTDMLKLLQRDVAAGRIKAVIEPQKRRALPQVHVSHAEYHVLHVPLGNATILIAPPSALPPELRQHRNSAGVADLLRTLPHGHPAGTLLDRQAHRLPGNSAGGITGDGLRHHVARLLEHKALDAVVVHDTAQIAAVAGRHDAPMPVSQLDDIDKIMMAMQRSIPLMRGDVVGLARLLCTKENAAKFVAMLLVFGALQYVPVVNVLLDAWILLELIIAVGDNGVKGIKLLGKATYAATKAGTDAQIDAAAHLYKGGFEAMGVAGLSWILARLHVNMMAAKAEAKALEMAAKAEREAAQKAARAAAEKAEREAAAESAKKAGQKTVAETIAERRALARKFYEDAGMDPKKIDSHLEGIDFTKPVEVVKLEPGTTLTQYKYPDRPVGNYFCPEGSSPKTLGIDPAGRVPVEFKATEPIQVLKSSAADLKDWNGGDAIFKGGGTQYFIPQKSTMAGAGGL